MKVEGAALGHTKSSSAPPWARQQRQMQFARWMLQRRGDENHWDLQPAWAREFRCTTYHSSDGSLSSAGTGGSLFALLRVASSSL